VEAESIITISMILLVMMILNKLIKELRLFLKKIQSLLKKEKLPMNKMMIITIMMMILNRLKSKGKKANKVSKMEKILK
jgi:hypothetical protein